MSTVADKNERVMAFHEELGEIYYYKGTSRNWTMQNYHYHETCEIILIMSNGNTVDVNSSRFKTSFGDLLLFRSNEPHRVNAPEESDYSRYVIMFDPKIIRSMFEPLSYSCLKYFDQAATEGTFRRITLSGQALANLVNLMDRIDPYYSMRQDPEAHAMLYLLIAEVLVSVQNLFDFFHSNHDEEAQNQAEISFDMRDTNRVRVQRIKAYICENVESRLDLNAIANEFFINKYYLSHYFKKETGFSIMQYITMQKMIRAKQMLKQGCSIRNVAIALNYNSDSHFISTFQKHVGKTPKKYVQELHDSKNQ